MKHAMVVGLALALFGALDRSFAEFDDDITRSLTVQCNYSDYKTFQFETVLVEGTKKGTGDAASIKTFQRGEKSQNVTYIC